MIKTLTYNIQSNGFCNNCNKEVKGTYLYCYECNIEKANQPKTKCSDCTKMIKEGFKRCYDCNSKLKN